MLLVAAAMLMYLDVVSHFFTLLANPGVGPSAAWSSPVSLAMKLDQEWEACSCAHRVVGWSGG